MRTLMMMGVWILVTVSVTVGATVSGFVRDATNGESLYGANVFLKETRFGTITNEKGYYVITGIPAGEYELVWSYIGYLPHTMIVSLPDTADRVESVELTPKAIAMEAVEVKADKEAYEVTPSKISLRRIDLKNVTQVVEADLFRAVQALPGVATLSDFSAGLYVRGGSADQNLILLDDIDVYNPNHLFGFFSTFNVDAVKSVELQKGGFPARYGGRLSSLLNVYNREGNRKEFQGVTRLSVISSSLTMDGPWAKGSWMVSGRHTYIEQLAKALNLNLPYKFYDAHVRLNYDISPTDRVSFSYYGGNDRLRWDEETLDLTLDWGNQNGCVQWTHLFNSRLFSHFVLGGSRFKSDNIIGLTNIEFKAYNKIDDLSVKGNLSYTPSPAHVLDFGFETKMLDFVFLRAASDDQIKFSYEGTYHAAYIQDNWQVSPVLRLQPGVRLSDYSEGNYLTVSPRISAEYRWTDKLATHLTYGRYWQFLNLVSEEEIGGAADAWFPVDETLKPGFADHYICGVKIGPYADFDLEIEAYYKPYARLVEFSDEFGRSAIDNDNTELGDAFRTGEGDAYGIDFYLRNRWQGFEGWIGYAWGKTIRQFDDYNQGKAYPPQYDRRHHVVLMQDYQLGKGWRININFKYGSGQPTTLSSGRGPIMDGTGRIIDLAYPGEKNRHRLPDYQRLDIGLFWTKHFTTWSIEPYLQLINIYNHENIYIRQYDTSTEETTYDDVTMLPRLPTLGININF